MADDTLPDRLRWACCRCDSQQCVACKAADEIERLRAAGDALAVVYRTLGGLDVAHDAPLRAWEEAHRG